MIERRRRTVRERAADRLAVAVARLIEIRALDARSEAGDALLDFLEVGGLGGPKDVPTAIAAIKALDEAGL